MRAFLVLIFVLCGVSTFAQNVGLNPTVTPALFRYNDQITVSYDMTGTALVNLPEAWLWIWIPGKDKHPKYNITPASSNTALTNNVKFSKVGNVFSLTFRPSDLFTDNISTETTLGMLLKSNDWPQGQTSDYLSNFWDGSFQVKLVLPAQLPLFVNTGDQVVVKAEVPVISDFNLYIDNVLKDTKTGLTIYNYSFNVAETSGGPAVKIVATSGATSAEITFQYLISTASPVQTRPAGIIAGINYGADPTKVTLCLWAPGKSSVYVQGDFSNWDVLPQNLMKRHGELFWIELSNLTPGQENGYRYLIDQTIYVADPYADKILDKSNDASIPAGTYPSLKPFPAKAVQDKDYFNRVAIFQTNQAPYVWQTTNFQKPVQEKLVIYELLVRDFFGANSRNYQNLIDTLSYFKRLGINAIELMPITEFNGNLGWGYNPTFMFAPDKYYGTKNKLKEFIDKCHQKGIAVIMDIVMNQQDIPNPYLMMDFDFTIGKPTINNKWFNVDATHPFSVFSDLNHESLYTKKYLDTINYYWMNEYKVDGYRFDLSKGFTQTNNPSNVGAWGAYDASRIAILKRMADKIWLHTPGAYVILEHFADNTEEKELAEYRAGEGKGMMLWANYNHAYNELTMGYSGSTDFSGIYFANRGWSVPHAVGYMESHDEERLVYKDVQFGNGSGSYNVKSLDEAVRRVEGANVVFYTIPGPKMIWEFGELGYDYSINDCGNGSVNSNCRTDAKPIAWEYQQVGFRKHLFNITADLMRLRNTYGVFTIGDATIPVNTGLIKQVMVKNKPYTATPANVSEMNAVAVANFDVTKQTALVSFPHTGTWFDYYAYGVPISVTQLTTSIELSPGQYKLYTDIQIQNPIVLGLEEENDFEITLYPNPSRGVLRLEAGQHSVESLSLVSMQGVRTVPNRIDSSSWDVSNFSPGLYLVEIVADGIVFRKKVIKH